MQGLETAQKGSSMVLAQGRSLKVTLPSLAEMLGVHGDLPGEILVRFMLFCAAKSLRRTTEGELLFAKRRQSLSQIPILNAGKENPGS